LRLPDAGETLPASFFFCVRKLFAGIARGVLDAAHAEAAASTTGSGK
jgi:hypothetical protein